MATRREAERRSLQVTELRTMAQGASGFTKDALLVAASVIETVSWAAYKRGVHNLRKGQGLWLRDGSKFEQSMDGKRWQG